MQRAKDEVARLNGVVSGSPSTAASDGGPPWRKKPVATTANSTPRQATAADRKQQLKQLAEMGVAIPDEFRKEMAMAGDWETLSQRVIYNDIKQEEDSKDFKSERSTIAARKRRHETLEEDEEAEERVNRKAWGSNTRAYPDAGGNGEEDLDSLLQNTMVIKRDAPLTDDSKSRNGRAIKQPAEAEQPQTEGTMRPEIPLIKKEDSDPGGCVLSSVPSPNEPREATGKTEDEPTEPGVVFKKRKARQIRQR